MAAGNETQTVAGGVTSVVSTAQSFWDKVSEYLLQNGMNLLAAILIFIIGKWVAKILAGLMEKLMIKGKVNQTLATFAKNLIYFILLIFVILAALEKIGIQTTSFIAIIGAAGLAVGLALQGSLANFAAGVMLIMFQPFQVGDFVEAGGATGTVHEIQIFSTVIYTDDKKKVIVPNSKITGDKITIYPPKTK
jgi:small conductance mechanosensitive channel